MIKVLFVCSTNISRSPMAEGVFRKKVADAGLEEMFYIRSRATIAYKLGSRPHKETIQILQTIGSELDNKVSEKINQNDYLFYDFIICMDYENIKYLNKHTGIYRDKVYLIRDIDNQTKGQIIPNPSNQETFEEVYQMIDQSLDLWLTMFKINKLLHFIDLNQYKINQKPLFLRNPEYFYWDKETLRYELFESAPVDVIKSHQSFYEDEE